MKLRAEEMEMLALDYGDLLRPEFEILTGRGWGQCTNATGEYLIVYGPKHRTDRSIFDTSPYVLPAGATTPDCWDCDGLFLPNDRALRTWRRTRHGPLAVKFWDFRRFLARREAAATYSCSWNNGVFEPSQINWAIPNLSYSQILLRIADAHSVRSAKSG